MLEGGYLFAGSLLFTLTMIWWLPRSMINNLSHFRQIEFLRANSKDNFERSVSQLFVIGEH